MKYFAWPTLSLDSSWHVLSSQSTVDKDDEGIQDDLGQLAPAQPGGPDPYGDEGKWGSSDPGKVLLRVSE